MMKFKLDFKTAHRMCLLADTHPDDIVNITLHVNTYMYMYIGNVHLHLPRWTILARRHSRVVEFKYGLRPNFPSIATSTKLPGPYYSKIHS